MGEGYNSGKSRGLNIEKVCAIDAKSQLTGSAGISYQALRRDRGLVGIARRNPNPERVLPKTFALPLETWLVMHEDLSSSPRMRTLFDHLGKGLKAYLASSR